MSLPLLHPYELVLCLHVADAQETALSNLSKRGMTLLSAATLTSGDTQKSSRDMAFGAGFTLGTLLALLMLFLFLCRLTFQDSHLVLWQGSPWPSKVGFAAWRAL